VILGLVTRQVNESDEVKETPLTASSTRPATGSQRDFKADVSKQFVDFSYGDL
jgi:hypothetical protein